MLLTIFTFLIVLSVLVLVHEFGHFLAAKKAGIKVEEFGFGYPPRLFGKKFGETIYSLNWLPFGGFVKLHGEELTASGKKDDRAFWAKSKKARMVVIVAGVLANFLLAIVVFSVVYSFSGIPTKTDKIKIVDIASDSPAEKFGLKEGDIILAVGENKISALQDFTRLVREKTNQLLKIVVKRDVNNPCQEKVLGGGTGFSCQNGNLILFITPRENPPEGEGPLGVAVSDMEMIKYPFWQMPFWGTIEGFKEAFGWTILIVNSLGKMMIDLVARGIVPKDVAGPVGIFQITGIVAKSGVLNVLQFIGILSVNLAVINILPFPALDGGRFIFVAYEVITRRRPRPSLENWINTAGMATLLFLIFLVTLNDLTRIINFSSLIEQIRLSFPK